MGSEQTPSSEVLICEPRRYLAVVVGTREAVITETRYPAGHAGAEPHIHRLHADIFHVVEGALMFLVGPAHTVHRLDAGATVIVPPGVVHGFDVAPDMDAVYVNVHAPGMGFDTYLRTRRTVPEAERDAFLAAYDIYDAPADGGLPADRAVIGSAGLVETWRGWAQPGDDCERVATVMAAALALVCEPA